MGEVSKRCKNQWMRWTAEGLEAILQLRLVKYADPEYYQAFLDELLQRSTKTAINCDLSIESTSGKKSRPLCNTTKKMGYELLVDSAKEILVGQHTTKQMVTLT